MLARGLCFRAADGTLSDFGTKVLRVTSPQFVQGWVHKRECGTLTPWIIPPSLWLT